MRSFLKALILGSVFCTLGWVSVAAAGTATPKAASSLPGAGAIFSFEQWKLKQVEEAQITYNVASMDMTLRARSRQAGGEEGAGSLQARVDQARLHLEVAKELGLHDYFVLYVAQLQSQEEFQKVVQHLSQEEAASLLKAYAEQLTGHAEGRSALLLLGQ